MVRRPSNYSAGNLIIGEAQEEPEAEGGEEVNPSAIFAVLLTLVLGTGCILRTSDLRAAYAQVKADLAGEMTPEQRTKAEVQAKELQKKIEAKEKN